MHFVTKFLPSLSLAVVVAGLGLAGFAHAQWGWTDKDGRRIFSDQGPTSEVPDKNIFKRPPNARATGAIAAGQPAASAAATPASAAAPAPKVAASGLKPSGKDVELEKKKKEAEDQEAAKKKAEDDKIAVQRKENCQRAKSALTTYASGVRIATTNAKGEREIMSDADRASETKRLQEVIGTECK